MSDARFCLRCGGPLAALELAGLTRRVCEAPGCEYVFYGNPVPVVAAIVEHDGAVLLVRNKGWPESWYGLVTGFLEAGETPEAGVLRELREELGLAGEVVRLVGVYAFTERNELIVAYHVRAAGTVVVGDELADVKRIDPAKLRPWPFGTGHAVRDWLAARSGNDTPRG